MKATCALKADWLHPYVPHVMFVTTLSVLCVVSNWKLLRHTEFALVQRVVPVAACGNVSILCHVYGMSFGG